MADRATGTKKDDSETVMAKMAAIGRGEGDAEVFEVKSRSNSPKSMQDSEDEKDSAERDKKAAIARRKERVKLSEEEKSAFEKQQQELIAKAKSGNLKDALSGAAGLRTGTINDDKLRRADMARREGLVSSRKAFELEKEKTPERFSQQQHTKAMNKAMDKGERFSPRRVGRKSRSRSPPRRRSPPRGRSPPRRRSKSPPRRRSPSPMNRRKSPPAAYRQSPPRRRMSRSPVRRRSPPRRSPPRRMESPVRRPPVRRERTPPRRERTPPRRERTPPRREITPPRKKEARRDRSFSKEKRPKIRGLSGSPPVRERRQKEFYWRVIKELNRCVFAPEIFIKMDKYNSKKT